MKNLILILGDQLSHDLSSLNETYKAVNFTLIFEPRSKN